MDLQEQYDRIYAFFKTTTEPFDQIDWDGETLSIILNEKTIEEYSLGDLQELIQNFPV